MYFSTILSQNVCLLLPFMKFISFIYKANCSWPLTKFSQHQNVLWYWWVSKGRCRLEDKSWNHRTIGNVLSNWFLRHNALTNDVQREFWFELQNALRLRVLATTQRREGQRWQISHQRQNLQTLGRSDGLLQKYCFARILKANQSPQRNSFWISHHPLGNRVLATKLEDLVRDWPSNNLKSGGLNNIHLSHTTERLLTGMPGWRVIARARARART